MRSTVGDPVATEPDVPPPARLGLELRVRLRPPNRRPMVLVTMLCLGLAVVTLLLPATLAFDPWAWLVWGREVGRLELDTTGGPSWKPLPVLVTTGLSPFGDHAATLWLVAARTAGLLSLVATFRLAARFAGPAAGVLAAGFLVLTPDAGPRFLRLVAEGHGEPVSALLTLWAVQRHLDGRRIDALLAGTGLALLRPEAWPFLVGYAAWLWRRDPAQRRVTVAVLLAVPLLWFGGDWWGSGDPWHGADAAQVASGDALDRLALGLRRATSVVVVPAWVAAGAAVIAARRRNDQALPALGGLAVAWLVLVTAMAVTLGYAALSRFLLPAAALLCVLAGVGAVRVGTGLSRRAGGGALVGLLAVVGLGLVAPRVLALDSVADGVQNRARLERDLDVALDQAGGPDAVLACGQVAIDPSDVPRMALAWKLDLPLGQIERDLDEGGAGVAFARVGSDLDESLTAGEPPRVEVLARSEEWTVYAVDCVAVSPR